MESVIFDGKEYLKASVLAQKFNYTQDYLGQLCRAKKVDARLVGRAWYLNLDSLNRHKDGRYKVPEKTAEISVKKPLNRYLSRIDVEPVLKNKTVKIFKKNGHANITQLAVKYEGDDYSLIPKINKEAVEVNVPVLPAEAERLRVLKNGTGHARFEPEALPEVWLEGSLKVNGLPEATEEVKTTDNVEVVVAEEINKILPIHSAAPKTVSLRLPQKQSVGKSVKTAVSPVPIQRKRSVVVLVPKKSVPTVVESKSVLTQPKNTVPAVSERNVVSTIAKVSFTPRTVAQSHRTYKKDSPKRKSSILIPVGVITSAITLGILIVATSAEVLVGDASYTDRFVVQLANLLSYKGLLPW